MAKNFTLGGKEQEKITLHQYLFSKVSQLLKAITKDYEYIRGNIGHIIYIGHIIFKASQSFNIL